MFYCRPVPGNTGSVKLFYERLTEISVGVLFVLAFDMVTPW